jgi:hypothetical protein
MPGCVHWACGPDENVAERIPSILAAFVANDGGSKKMKAGK